MLMGVDVHDAAADLLKMLVIPAKAGIRWRENLNITAAGFRLSPERQKFLE
jgi:hypothetical protein